MADRYVKWRCTNCEEIFELNIGESLPERCNGFACGRVGTRHIVYDSNL